MVEQGLMSLMTDSNAKIRNKFTHLHRPKGEHRTGNCMTNRPCKIDQLDSLSINMIEVILKL